MDPTSRPLLPLNRKQRVIFGGGTIYARNPIRQAQLIQLELPNYRAGCGGIDLFTGSMSFLSHQKLVDLGKQVMTNAGAYAVDVMLATTVPELKQVRDYLQSLEQAANHASINSCEMAQNLVGGVWPKTMASQQKICKDQGIIGKEGLFSDYAQARMDCASSGFHSAIEKANHDPELKKQVILNKNLVWSLLQEKPLFNADPELAELLMSLTGTIIIDQNGKISQVPSLLGHSSLLNALIGSHPNAQATIWHCDEINTPHPCLHVSLKDITLPKRSTLTVKVREIIESIQLKLQHDEKPTPLEIHFLGMTSLPILKFLTVLNSSYYTNAATDINEYANLIASDWLHHYLHDLLEEISQATAGSELNDDLIKEIRNRIRDAKTQLEQIHPNVSQLLQQKLTLIDYMGKIEKQVATDFTQPKS